MNNRELIELLVNDAKDYTPQAACLIRINGPMHEYRRRSISRPLIDAIVEDFINFVMAEQCVDLALHTKNLYKNEKHEPII